RVDQGDQRDQHEAERQPAAVRPGVRPEPLEDLADRHLGRGADQRPALGRRREQRTEPSSQSWPPPLPELVLVFVFESPLLLVSSAPVPGCAGVESEILPRRRRRLLWLDIRDSSLCVVRSSTNPNASYSP